MEKRYIGGESCHHILEKDSPGDRVHIDKLHQEIMLGDVYPCLAITSSELPSAKPILRTVIVAVVLHELSRV